MSVDLAKFVLEIRTVVKLTETKNSALQKKMIALAIDPLLASTRLEDGMRIASSNRTVFDYVLGKMTLPQLKRLSKAWNPYRAAIPKEMGLSDLRKELVGLINGAEPAPLPVRRAPARKSGAPRSSR